MMNKLLDTEKMLIESKMTYASATTELQAENDDLHHRVKALEDQLKQLTAQRDEAEKGFVDIKMKFAIVQMEKSDLEREIFESKAKK